MTPEDAQAHIAASDPRFALTEAVIGGVRYPVFANAPAHLRVLLEDAAPAYGDRDALVYQDERWRHAELCREVRRVANALADDLGVRQGDPVAIAMRNYPELPILILAVAALGAVAVPMNAWWSEQELAYGLNDCGARVVFADGPRHQRIEKLAADKGLTLIAVRDAEPLPGQPRYEQLRDGGRDDRWPDVTIAPDDDFAVLYSSGSTGNPKGVVLTHRGAISAVYSWIMARLMAPLVADPPPPLPEPDKVQPPSFLVVTPLFHVTALQSNFLQGLASGATLTLMYKWDPEEAVRLIKRERVTRFTGVPTHSRSNRSTVASPPIFSRWSNLVESICMCTSSAVICTMSSSSSGRGGRRTRSAAAVAAILRGNRAVRGSRRALGWRKAARMQRVPVRWWSAGGARAKRYLSAAPRLPCWAPCSLLW